MQNCNNSLGYLVLVLLWPCSRAESRDATLYLTHRSTQKSVSIPVNITAHATVLTTEGKRACLTFLDQLPYFTCNAEDEDNSKYCNKGAKYKVSIWTKGREQMHEWLRKEEVSARGRTASGDLQMVGRKRIRVWQSGKYNPLQKALRKQHPTMKRFHCPSVPWALTQPRWGRWGSDWARTQQAVFSSAAERANQRGEHMCNETLAISNHSN